MASNTASRVRNIPNVDTVINSPCPLTIEDYIHRTSAPRSIDDMASLVAPAGTQQDDEVKKKKLSDAGRQEMPASLKDFHIDHLYRHFAELTRQGKGGYLKGEIFFQKDLLQNPLMMQLSLVADPRSEFRLHLSLIHI